MDFTNFLTVGVRRQSLNGGKNGGRICWAISHTFCDEKEQGEAEQKKVYCLGCDVYKMVKNEEGDAFYFAGQTAK